MKGSSSFFEPVRMSALAAGSLACPSCAGRKFYGDGNAILPRQDR
jgi:hypothetical protein